MGAPTRTSLPAPLSSTNKRLPPPAPLPPSHPSHCQDGTRPDLLATSGDFLRLWRVSDDPGAAQQGVALEKLLNNVGVV